MTSIEHTPKIVNLFEKAISRQTYFGSFSHSVLSGFLSDADCVIGERMAPATADAGISANIPAKAPFEPEPLDQRFVAQQKDRIQPYSLFLQG
jgi:hypothetical protein